MADIAEDSAERPDRRRFVMGASLGAAVLAASTASAQAPPPGEDVRVGALRLHVARSGAKSVAGVLLHPRIAGLEPRMRAYAAELAAAGFTAVVWDPYNGEDVTGGTMAQLARSKRLTDRAVIADLKTATDYMERELGLTSIGALGWCLGGRTALLQAGMDSRLKAVTAYHPTIYSPTPVDLGGGAIVSKKDFPGQTMDEMTTAARIAGAVQIVRPGHDLCQPAEYERLRQSLYSRKAPTLIDYYPEAEHGFPYQLGKPANAAANAVAWPSTLAFLKARLL